MSARELKTFQANVRPSTTAAFWICLIASIALFVASFCVPPYGVIDGSVLKAVAFLFGFATLATAREAIREGLGAKVTHGETTIEINKDENSND